MMHGDQVSPSPARIRVFILNGHALVRQGLRELLESEGFDIVGASGLAADATLRIPALHPDVSLLDARLPDGTGIEVCRDVRSADPTLACLILTSAPDDQAQLGAALAGAAGFVPTVTLNPHLLRRIRCAASGQSLTNSRTTTRRIADLVTSSLLDSRHAQLTLQERRILSLISDGMTNRQIGGTLFLTEAAVRESVGSLLAKLGFQRRTPVAGAAVTDPDGRSRRHR